MNPEKVLPPGVNGKTSGHLTVKVDEVFWTRNSPGEIFVDLKWWGETESTIFSPEDITHNENKKKNGSSVTYAIRTSPGLFEAYLRNCEKLTFSVLRGQNKNVMVGSAVVKDIHQIVSEKSHHSYFPIFSPKGLRIGDLHICFELSFTKKHSRVAIKSQDDLDAIQPKDFRNKHLKLLSSKSTSATSQEDQLLSDLLQKGNELRKAMVMSVLSDCPVDKIEEFVSQKNDKIPVGTKKSKHGAKLVDFLQGKDMTPEEEMAAIETLRCVSPDDYLVNIANEVGDSKVTKTTCCLHGKQCNKKPEVLPQKTVPISSKTSETDSTVPTNKIQDDAIDETSEGKASARNLNCYRLIIKTLNLTNDGSRKIYYAPVLNDFDPLREHKSNRCNNPPGTSFILEVNVPSKGVWARNLKFMTKSFRGKCVDFSLGTTHRLCGTVTWERVKSNLLGSVFTVFWRHLNQRVPCPLGVAKLESFSISDNSDESVSLVLPVYSNTRLLTGHLNILITLGEMSRRGGEALFNYKEEKPETSSSKTIGDNISADTDGYSAQENARVKPLLDPSEESVVPCSSASSVDSTDLRKGPSSLDDELVRTIKLLNSKSDKGGGDAKEPKKAQDRETFVTKREACVQTSLSLDDPDNSNGAYTKTSQREEKPALLRPRYGDTLKPEQHSCSTKFLNNDVHNPINGFTTDSSSVPTLQKEKYFEPIYDDFYHPHERYYHEVDMPERLRVAPKQYTGSERIHEYTIKIEKVVGVPLFTGDNDMDCYVDYSFPKVDTNGLMIFDRVAMGTEVRIALRETEFNTISRHRLRLSCKLTRALLTLPTHEIAFSLWGRFYRPSPQDFKLGKAFIPLTKLSALELKYEQQVHQQPIVEKFVLPIEVLESSVTSGYKGPFGEMHITIAYSNASGLSYREWRCKNKDDHYWCRSHLLWNKSEYPNTVPYYECVKAHMDLGDENRNTEVTSNLKRRLEEGRSHYKNEDLNLNTYQRELIGEPYGTNIWRTNFATGTHDLLRDNNELNDFKQDLPRNEAGSSNWKRYEDITNSNSNFQNDRFRREVQSNFVNPDRKYITEATRHIPSSDYLTELSENGYIAGSSNGIKNQAFPSRSHKESLVYSASHGIKRRMQPIGENIKELDQVNHRLNDDVYGYKEGIKDDHFDSVMNGKRENIVEKVLRDIKERKERCEQKTPLNPNAKETETLKDGEDVFDSFDLRVDLPSRDDSGDFEARSQYSFLKTPPPGEGTFPHNTGIDFETASSTSIKHKLHDDNSVNPFSSQSNISFSLNCDSAIFKPPHEKDKHMAFGGQGNLKSVQPSTSKINKQKRNLDSINSSNGSKISERKKSTMKRPDLECHPSGSDSEHSLSNDGTLKSVESLGSYKEEIARQESRDVAVWTDFGLENKDTQTSRKEKEYFQARVEICRALGLPSLEVKQNDGKITLVKPTSHAYFTAVVNNKEVILKTPVVEKKSNPVWDSAWDVCLPVDLLKKCDRELEIFVDLSGDTNESLARLSDVSINWPIVLRTGIDLTPMTAGLEHASGWFSLSDRALMSRAQIKMIVTPLEDISQFREDWLKEYTKSKSRKLDFTHPERNTSIATSLQEKLLELEKLTQRMRHKMANKSKWDVSPPLSLLSEVEKKGSSFEEVISVKSSRSEKKGKQIERIVTPVKTPVEADKISIISISDDDDDDKDRGSDEVINTYTVSMGSDKDRQSHTDSLETPSETIERLITRVRSNR